MVLRLDNLQVANAFNDGPLRYEYDWLRRNDKDMATRLRGSWMQHVALKVSVVFERCISWDILSGGKSLLSMTSTKNGMSKWMRGLISHCLTDDMPLYVSFKRQARRQTQLWYIVV